MGARLDPAERDRRAKARRQASWDRIRSGEAYRHFDPNDGLGYGSRAQWRSAAGGNGWTAQEPDEAIPEMGADLRTLGLAAAPRTRTDLTRAYRKAAMRAHPDAGGSHAAFIELGRARDRVAKTVRAG